MAKMIKVKSLIAPRVAIWERDPAHPGGECFVADDEVHEVANTPFVQDRILKKMLVEVGEPPKREKAAKE